MNQPATYLSGFLGEIEQAAGLPATLKIAEAVGGTKVYFPSKPKRDHWLVKLVGIDKARAICEKVTPAKSGIEIMVPWGPCGSRRVAWSRINDMLDRGLNKPAVVRATGLDPRTIQRHKNGQSGNYKPDPYQKDLFKE